MELRSFREECIACPQSGGEDPGSGMFAASVGVELALLEQAVHDGVVLRELRERRIAEQVETRIADVNIVQLGTAKNRAMQWYPCSNSGVLSTVTNGEICAHAASARDSSGEFASPPR